MGADDRTFSDALRWHLREHGTRTVDLARGSGVSRDIINQLKSGRNRSTAPENATAIAAYYGKTYDQFINLEPVAFDDAMVRRFMGLMSEDEKRLLWSQMQGIVAGREKR